MTTPLTTPQRATGQQTIVRVEDHNVKLHAGAHRNSPALITDAEKLYSDLQEAWLRDWTVTIEVLGNTYRIAPGGFVPARREASYRHGEHVAAAGAFTGQIKAVEAAHQKVYGPADKPKLSKSMRAALETIDDHGGAYVTGRGFADIEPGSVKNEVSRVTANRLLNAGLVEWEKVPVNERRMPRLIRKTTTSKGA